MQKQLEAVKIMIELEDSELYNATDSFALCLRLSVKNRVPAVQIIKMLRDQIQHCPRKMIRLMGISLTKKIWKYEC